jgi:molybdopterin-guanine dinucleotide biosynthesis protein A
MISLPDSTPAALGAILAGGASRRFGAPKALATVGGVAMIERARAALADAGLTPVLIGSRPELADLDLPLRPDRVAESGPLAGIHAALAWAREMEMKGALCVACDLPLLTPVLLRDLWERGVRSEARAVVPDGPDGAPEPLCAWYSVRALPEIEARLARRDLRMRSLLEALAAERVPAAGLERYGEPAHLFLNVNTPAERERAERIAASLDRKGEADETA